jgi:hypothetical protein
MSTLRQEAHAFRSAANQLRRETDPTVIQHKREQAAIFERMAAEIEDHLERTDDGEIVAVVDPDAPKLFEEQA